MNITVSSVIIAKTKKNPRINDIVCENLFFRRECPITMGISGRTQGDRTDIIPVKKETNKLTFILIPYVLSQNNN